jgi:3'-phosphoadenosine 5'-phosphosulfate (PAPS) 3'-phosphatase
MTSVNLLDLAAAALSSVIMAADQIKDMSSSSSSDDDKMNARLKTDGSFVTNADFAAQSIIVQALQNISPDIRIVGEENEEEMARQRITVTGHEEKSSTIFQLAQEEISLRYNLNSGTTTVPLPLSLPLAQTSTQGSPSTTPTTTPTTEIDHQKMEEYEVDPSRVSVFIDPLDGTNAYAQGEYETVSILAGIILDHKPCFGVICKPFGYAGHTSVLDTGCVAFYGGSLLGAAYTAGGASIGKITTKEEELPRAVISSSKAKGVVQDFVTHLGNKDMLHPEPLMVSGAGEKSLRIILRSENEGLWFSPKAGTSLWDVAASDAILRTMGGRLTDKHGNEMDYSKSQEEALNQNGVIACYDEKLHAECIRLFMEGSWTAES